MAIRPAKVIQGAIQATEVVETWDYDDGTGDPWVGVPYKFRLLLNITAQQQSSPSFGEQPFFYTGRDVRPGDWLFSSGGARVLLITAIDDQVDPNNILIQACDDDRVNVANDSTQMGAAGIQEGDCFIFEAPGGIPALYPLPPNMPGPIPSQASAEIMARFASMRKDRYVEVIQPMHGFAVGQAVTLGADGIYYASTAFDTEHVACGVVADVRDTASGPNKFVYAPVGPVISLALPAAQLGDLVYIDSDGSYTATPVGEYAQPTFIKITDEQAILINAAQAGDHFAQHVNPDVLFAASKSDLTWSGNTLTQKLEYRKTGAVLRLMYTVDYTWGAGRKLQQKTVTRAADGAVRQSSYTWDVQGRLTAVDRIII